MPWVLCILADGQWPPLQHLTTCTPAALSNALCIMNYELCIITHNVFPCCAVEADHEAADLGAGDVTADDHTFIY